MNWEKKITWIVSIPTANSRLVNGMALLHENTDTSILDMPLCEQTKLTEKYENVPYEFCFKGVNQVGQ